MNTQKLISLQLSKLHQAEFGQFISRFFEDVENTSIDVETDADFKFLFDELKAKIPTYNKALEQVRASEESKRIAELDKVRGKDLQAFKDSIKPYKSGKTTAQKEAYTAIKIVLDTHKNVVKEGYEKQTSQINTLISILRSEKYAPHITTLKVGYFLQEVENSNKAFNDAFAFRSAQNLQRETYNAKELRKEMTEIYQRISNYIVSVAFVRQDAFYKKVLEALNNSRKYFADVVAIRAAKSSKEKAIAAKMKELTS